MLALVAAAAVLVPVGANPSAAQSSGDSGVVVVANGWSPADVGAAAPLAGRLDAAVLYASKNSLGQPTVDALKELNPSRVLLMGGPAALSASVQSQVRETLSGATVERFSGTDRIDTAAKAALSAPRVPSGRPVVIASGWSPSDVGAAAPLAAQLEGSVLYAGRKELGGPTVAALGSLAPSRVIIVGGLAAIGTDLEAQIASIAPRAVIERLSGADRVDTAALGIDLAGVALGGPVVLASGWSAPDVGIAAPLAGALGGSVLVTQRSGLGDRTAEALADFNPSQIILIGGTAQFAAAIYADLDRLHPTTPARRIAGADRIATAAIAALLGAHLSERQERFRDAVATITPGKTDCGAVPALSVTGIEIIDAPADLDDPAVPLTVAEIIRIAGGCALVEYAALKGHTVAHVRQALADEPTVFAVGEPVRGVRLLHLTGAHHGYGPKEHTHRQERAPNEQWYIPQQYMAGLWDNWNDDNSVAVAVLDTGVDQDHPDLQGRVVSFDGKRNDIYEHQPPKLGGCHVNATWDGEDDNDEYSGDAHGTHVAGIIAANRNADGNPIGVAPDAKIIPLNVGRNDWPTMATFPYFWVFGDDKRDCAERSDSDTLLTRPLSVADGVISALGRGAKIINMSFAQMHIELPLDDCGGFDSKNAEWGLDSEVPFDFAEQVKLHLGRDYNSECDPFRTALEIADELDVVAVAGVGNCADNSVLESPPADPKNAGKRAWEVGPRCPGHNAISLPAAFDSVIAVAAVDEDGKRAKFSTVGDYADIAAPGVDMLSAVPTDAPNTLRRRYDGTSSASPFVAGVVAHMLNRHPDAQPWQVRRALTDTARYPSSLGSNAEQNKKGYGHGIIQPREAILRLGELTDPNRTANHINGLRLTGRTCLFADDTPSCADPIPLSLEPRFAASAYPSLRHYAIQVPHNIAHVSVDVDYDNGGRPYTLDMFPHDAERNVTGHQFNFPRHADKTILKIWLPSWKGYRAPSPYELTFRRTDTDDTDDSTDDKNELPAVTGANPLAMGANHSCAIRSNGRIACWGDDTDGKVSDAPSGAFTSITAGRTHTCAIRTDQAVRCWGNNDHGQSDAPDGHFTKVTIGSESDTHFNKDSDYSCGLKTTGEIHCWGGDTHGQVDNAPSEVDDTPSEIDNAPSERFIALASGVTHSCAIKRDQSVRCWGHNDAGQVSDVPRGAFANIYTGHRWSCAVTSTGEVSCWGTSRYSLNQAPEQRFRMIAHDNLHICGVVLGGTKDRDVECWGQRDGGARPPSGHFRTLSAGDNLACGIRTDGTISCWGDNSYGQSRDAPAGNSFQHIASGEHHSCAMRTSGTVTCWGDDRHNQSTPPSSLTGSTN